MGKMNGNLLDVHGAGAQRSDPKSGNQSDYPQFKGPQGDVRWVYNYVRCVRDADNTPVKNSKTHFRDNSFSAKIIGNRLMLELPFEQKNVNINLYQVNGKKLASFRYEKNISSNRISFVLPNSISSGVYLVSLENNSKFLKQRIVIQ